MICTKIFLLLSTVYPKNQLSSIACIFFSYKIVLNKLLFREKHHISRAYLKNHLCTLYTVPRIRYNDCIKSNCTNQDCVSHKGGENMEVSEMTAKETTNIILKLTQEGWDANKINEFIVFIETHRPSEDEAMNILKNKTT